MKTEKVPLKDIDIRYKDNPRLDASYKDEEFIALKKSIKADGQKNPIRLCRVKGSDKYRIIGGFRRTRAIEEIYHSEDERFVHAVIEEVELENDEAVQREAVLDQMRTKDFTHIEKAKAYKNLKDSGMSIGKISEKVGVGYNTVKSCLNLLDFPSDIQVLAEDKESNIKNFYHANEFLDQHGREGGRERKVYDLLRNSASWGVKQFRRKLDSYKPQKVVESPQKAQATKATKFLNTIKQDVKERDEEEEELSQNFEQAVTAINKIKERRQQKRIKSKRQIREGRLVDESEVKEFLLQAVDSGKPIAPKTLVRKLIVVKEGYEDMEEKIQTLEHVDNDLEDVDPDDLFE